MSTYNYRCLPPGCIRLLRLSPHEDDNAPIRCQLIEYSLASARRGSHLYEALSYCWGSPTTSQTAVMDAGLLHITENLHEALLALRDPALERTIWVDAICINQDDLDEKEQQVKLMAEIYARASCVIVWLASVTGDDLIDGEFAADDRQAIRALEAAATSLTKAPQNEQDRLAVEKLLGKPWFRRIWVLQEVAAARHVLIMCKLAEIDGQAFCLGLKQMGGSLLLEDEDAWPRIRSTINLIESATTRPKDVGNTSEQFSLQISSLGYLIELHHHTREATDRRDKIYALLGMSTDKSAGLVPNYQISWKDLFPHVVKSLLPGSSSVTTIDEHETALIRIQGCVIGIVACVGNENNWQSEQSVVIAEHRSIPLVENHSWPNRSTFDWVLQATTKRIQRGDAVCLLQGASLPTIVRAHKDYCSIVAIAVDTDVDMTPVADCLHINTQVDFLLTWSWKAETHPSSLSDLLDARGPSSMSCITLQLPNDMSTAIMLLETEQYHPAMLKAHSIIVASDDVDESERPDAATVTRFLALVDGIFLERPPFKTCDVLRNFLGKRRGYVDVTEDFLIQIASAPGWEPVAFILDTQGNPTTISENILTAVAKNLYHGENIMKVLLSRREDQVIVTGATLKAVAKAIRPGTGRANLLMHNEAVQICITEEFVIDIVGEPDKRSWIDLHQIFTRNSPEDFRRLITENVLVAAAANEGAGTDILAELLHFANQRDRSDITITENVLAAAAKNKNFRGIMLDILCSRGTVTDNALKMAYQSLSDDEGRAALRLKMEGKEAFIPSTAGGLQYMGMRGSANLTPFSKINTFF